MPEPLPSSERAYRRGCLQAVQFLAASLREVPLERWPAAIADWQTALVEGRCSPDVEYLGQYLDEVRRRIKRMEEADEKRARLRALGWVWIAFPGGLWRYNNDLPVTEQQAFAWLDNYDKERSKSE